MEQQGVLVVLETCTEWQQKVVLCLQCCKPVLLRPHLHDSLAADANQNDLEETFSNKFGILFIKDCFRSPVNGQMSAAVSSALFLHSSWWLSSCSEKNRISSKNISWTMGGCQSLIRFNKHRGRGQMSAAVTLHCWRKKTSVKNFFSRCEPKKSPCPNGGISE